MHLMHKFELWVSQETAAHAAYMSWIAMWCPSPVRVSESAACCALVSVVTWGWGRGQPCSIAHFFFKKQLLSFQSPAQKKFEIFCWPFWWARGDARARYTKACVISQYSGYLDTSHKNQCTTYILLIY